MPGDIVLLHDYRAGGVDVLLGVLPRVIDELRARGFDFVRVDSECRTMDAEESSPSFARMEKAEPYRTGLDGSAR
jgi:hypothetical protein